MTLAYEVVTVPSMLRMTRLREERKFTKAELARRAKMHPSSIGQIESGSLRPYPSQLEKIARALEVKRPSTLLDEVDAAR